MAVPQYSARKGYPDPIGGRSRLWLGDVGGPASYTQWTAPNTGGDVVNARYMGLSSINFIAATGLSESGTYYVEAKLSVAGGASPMTAILVWFLASSPGTQASAATNLSGESIALMAIGG